MYSQSSPVGPAEHCAGGSRLKSFSSLKEVENKKSKAINKFETDDLHEVAKTFFFIL